MTADRQVADSVPVEASITDQPADAHVFQVRSSEPAYDGKIIRVRRDIVAMPGGGESQRDVVEHPGAVGIVALDDDDRVLMVRQYRHPVRRHLWELPAGLLDVAGEPPLDAAHRELAEEAGLRARDWRVLVDALNSPGMSDEAVRIYLARGVEEIGADERHNGEDEEAEMTTAWVPLDEAVRRVLAGDVENGMAVMAVLATAWARSTGYAELRPADAPWPAKPSHAG